MTVKLSIWRPSIQILCFLTGFNKKLQYLGITLMVHKCVQIKLFVLSYILTKWSHTSWRTKLNPDRCFFGVKCGVIFKRGLGMRLKLCLFPSGYPRRLLGLMAIATRGFPTKLTSRRLLGLVSGQPDRVQSCHGRLLGLHDWWLLEFMLIWK